MAQFARWFLDPDHQWLTSLLADHGFGRETISEILAESYPESEIRTTVRDAARHSIAMFEEVAMLESHRTADAFEAAGLMDEAKRTPAPKT